MALVVIGALLVVAGIAIAAVRTAGQGRLSQPNTQISGQISARPNTLEPPGKGRRLNFKADLLGLGVAAVGVLLIFAGALF